MIYLSLFHPLPYEHTHLHTYCGWVSVTTAIITSSPHHHLTITTSFNTNTPTTTFFFYFYHDLSGLVLKQQPATVTKCFTVDDNTVLPILFAIFLFIILLLLNTHTHKHPHPLPLQFF